MCLMANQTSECLAVWPVVQNNYFLKFCLQFNFFNLKYRMHLTRVIYIRLQCKRALNRVTQYPPPLIRTPSRLAVLSFVQRLSSFRGDFLYIHKYFRLVLCWEVCPLFGVSFIRGFTVARVLWYQGYVIASCYSIGLTVQSQY